MSDGHVHIPPPEFDPRQVEALRRVAQQNHENAGSQGRLLGSVAGLVWSVVSWPVRVVLRLRRGEASDGHRDSSG